MPDLETNLEPVIGSAIPGATFSWQRVIELTNQMLQAAKDEEWESLAQIEEERRTLIYTHPPAPPADPAGRAVVLQTVQQILDIDRQIISLCQEGQQVLAGKLHSLRVGARARQAYGV
ncbi:flagellar protein FliT [Gammaproteobacteria bacterium]